MENKTGLDALLAVEPEAGQNVWVLEGWEPVMESPTETKFVLVLEGNYRTRKMASNFLLKELSKFEKKNPGILFKNALGGQAYKKKVKITFTYTPRFGGKRSFQSVYGDVKIELAGGNPPAVSKSPDGIGSYA